MRETLGKYKILERIGSGGMGEVYRARDTSLGRTVAIKVVPESIARDEQRRERFLADARATATLSHPSIAALYEIGEDEGQLFLAFEYVPGEPLSAVIAGRPIKPRRAIDFAVQIADALADAHAEGIVHRDIKPDNIIVTPKDKAKILDFGLAAWTKGGAERRQAAAVTLAAAGGAPPSAIAYMSPEEALGQEVDHRADIFSLGVVIFEMLTGRLPFSGATGYVRAPLPTSVNRTLPPEVDPILQKALAKRVDHRYESPATLSAELRSVGAILDVRSEVSEASAPPFTAPRRSSSGWILLILLLAALAALAWYERDEIQQIWRRIAPEKVARPAFLMLGSGNKGPYHFS